MTIFDRSVYTIDLNNQLEWQAMIRLIFTIYKDCGTMLLSLPDESEESAVTRLNKHGLNMTDKSKKIIIKAIKDINNKNVNIYYIGSAQTRSIKEIPIISANFFKSIPDNYTLIKQADIIKSVIEDRSFEGANDLLFKRKLILTNQDLLPVMKIINQTIPITNLLYLANSHVIQFVSSGYLFTLTKLFIKDGTYYKLDLDDGFFDSSHEASAYNEYNKCFAQWKLKGRKGPIFSHNIIA